MQDFHNLQAFLVPFMLAFNVEPDDEPILGIAFRIIDLLLGHIWAFVLPLFTGPILKPVTALLNHFKEDQVHPVTKVYL